MDAYVNIEIQDGIGAIEFFHPQSNSLPRIILEQLASSITDAGNNVEIKVLILKSGGERANSIASKKVQEIKRIIGF